MSTMSGIGSPFHIWFTSICACAAHSSSAAPISRRGTSYSTEPAGKAKGTIISKTAASQDGEHVQTKPKKSGSDTLPLKESPGGDGFWGGKRGGLFGIEPLMLDELCGTQAVLLLLPPELTLDERLDQTPASARAAVEQRDLFNCGHVPKVGVRHFGRDRKNRIFWSLGDSWNWILDIW